VADEPAGVSGFHRDSAERPGSDATFPQFVAFDKTVRSQLRCHPQYVHEQVSRYGCLRHLERDVVRGVAENSPMRCGPRAQRSAMAAAINRCREYRADR